MSVIENWPNQITAPQDKDRRIAKNPKEQDYCSPCCGALLSLANLSGPDSCYFCAICSACRSEVGCVYKEPSLQHLLAGMRYHFPAPIQKNTYGL